MAGRWWSAGRPLRGAPVAQRKAMMTGIEFYGARAELHYTSNTLPMRGYFCSVFDATHTLLPVRTRAAVSRYDGP